MIPYNKHSFYKHRSKDVHIVVGAGIRLLTCIYVLYVSTLGEPSELSFPRDGSFPPKCVWILDMVLLQISERLSFHPHFEKTYPTNSHVSF